MRGHSPPRFYSYRNRPLPAGAREIFHTLPGQSAQRRLHQALARAGSMRPPRRSFTRAMTRPMSFIELRRFRRRSRGSRPRPRRRSAARGGNARSPRSRPPPPRRGPRGRPCDRSRRNSRRCLIIFCSTSVTSASSSLGAAPVRASMSRFLIAAGRGGACPSSLSPPFIAAIVAALMSSRIIGLAPLAVAISRLTSVDRPAAKRIAAMP